MLLRILIRIGTSMYSLRKSRHILKSSYKSYKSKRSQLSADQLVRFETLLAHLDQAVLAEDATAADPLARQTAEFCHAHFKKGIGTHLFEMLVAIVIALVVATVVRQVWFELYEIPSGSMRPTFKEKDHLTVTKTAFGLNVPLETRHFYFDPALVQRTSVMIWSGDGIPHLDSASTFMGIFPYTKRYIKRCMGKPGDTLYFYGGRIYGFDRDGNDLRELRENPWTTRLEYIPFTNFEGRRSYIDSRRLAASSEVIFHHFNEAIGRLVFSGPRIQAQIFDGQHWVKDRPEAQKMPHQTLQTYSDFWGIRNFAMARLLDKSQLEALTSYRADSLEPALLYLELRHTPSLGYPPALLSDRAGAFIEGYTTVIPLQERHLKALADNLYTCRFVVKNGRATAYRIDSEKFYSGSPAFPGVPDGIYEFYYGQGYSIGWGGIASKLPTDHPLYDFQPTNIQRLFNLGIDMTMQVAPHNRNQPFYPSRYAYFREGELYVMGGLLMAKKDPFLVSFHEREKKKEEASTLNAPYVAFKDYGPPLTAEGELDKTFITTFGLKIPEKHYLALGDNHAMSQDSRYFGPIPEANLQGAPSLIFWPPGDRWGVPNQKPYPLLTAPRLIVWTLAALIGLIWWIIHRYNLKKPTFRKLP